MRGFVLAVLIGLVGAPAAAETITAGSGGGFWCLSEEDFAGTVAGKYDASKDKLGPSCRKIASGAAVEASLAEKKPGLAYGVGRFDGKESMPFLVFQDEASAQQPAATAKAPADVPFDAKRAFKRVSPADVRNSPDKWQGRPIEFADVQVYWIDDKEVRVLTKTNVTLFLGKYVANDDMKHFSQECETEAEALSKKCRATVRFVYSKHLEDNPTSSMTRTVLISRDAELTRKR